MNRSALSRFIKSQASILGFDQCGISKADFLEEEAPRLEAWLKKRMHGKMAYMENHFDKRLDPRLLVDGAKSVVSLRLNYYPEKNQSEGIPKISKYAYGNDYHSVIKQKLKSLIDSIQKEAGEINCRAFVDSAPVLDKAWAKKSGLGWIGKNSNLINRSSGSFFFLAELILDLELDYDQAVTDHCGTCTRCIDACPTGAIVQPYVVDGSRCISYLTIELKDQIPSEFKDKMDGWMFGCDVCQDVCPWNRFSKPHQTKDFDPYPDHLTRSDKEWEEMTEEVFVKIFKDSALSRPGFNGIKRNLNFLR